MPSLRPRPIGTMVLAAGLLTMAIPVAASGSAPPAGLQASPTPTDVSASPAGVAAVAAARQRFAALWPTEVVPRLGVWTDALGVLVAPAGTTFERRAWQSADGRRGTVLVPLTPLLRPTPGPAARARAMGGVVTSVGAPAWTWLAQACFSRSSDVWSWLDHCYQLYDWVGTNGADYWQLLRYGTAGANLPWQLHGATIGSYATAASAVQSWVQWAPLGDQTGACQQITVQITSPAIGIAWPVSRCDTWTIAKGQSGGSFDLKWGGSETRGQRGLAYVVAVKVPHGAFAQWALPGGSNGAPF